MLLFALLYWPGSRTLLGSKQLHVVHIIANVHNTTTNKDKFWANTTWQHTGFIIYLKLGNHWCEELSQWRILLYSTNVPHSATLHALRARINWSSKFTVDVALNMKLIDEYYGFVLRVNIKK